MPHNTLQRNPQEGFPTIGQTIKLPSGAVLKTPHPDTLAHLQELDPRVRYFPTDMELARNAPANFAYYRGVADVVHNLIHQEFGDETLAVRGTVASITDAFPFWPDGGGGTNDMQSVRDILRTGSDNGKDMTRVSILPSDGELDSQTHLWLNEEAQVVDLELQGTPEADMIFPIVVVYRQDAFEGGRPTHGFNELQGNPEERVAAIYITDKITM